MATKRNSVKTFELHSRIEIPKTPAEVFPFFADAANLDVLTPPWLHFKILSPQPIEMQKGTEIDYGLRLRGFPIRWRSRITEWEPPYLFVDEQTRGPYRVWVHEHHVSPMDGGTLVEDRVRYAVWGGGIANRLMVAPDLGRIFAYRRTKLEERFSGANEPVQA
jgi:ligand-binding SRPBCC domain-containing protein